MAREQLNPAPGELLPMHSEGIQGGGGDVAHQAQHAPHLHGGSADHSDRPIETESSCGAGPLPSGKCRAAAGGSHGQHGIVNQGDQLAILLLQSKAKGVIFGFVLQDRVDLSTLGSGATAKKHEAARYSDNLIHIPILALNASSDPGGRTLSRVVLKM